jgi:hypothetical protein
VLAHDVPPSAFADPVGFNEEALLAPLAALPEDILQPKG